MSADGATAAALPDIYYPSSDGQPMGETEWHIEALFALHGALKGFFANRPDVYVASNMLLYYEQGNPNKFRSPDCMILFGVGKHPRRSIKTWVEGTAPAVIFELSSEETYREDLGAKRELYARLGVGEYFLFDPLGDCLGPRRLRGLRLEGGAYVEMAPEADGGLTSATLGLRLLAEGSLLRLVDLQTGDPLPTWDELGREARRMEREHRRAERAARKAERERLRADELAAEVQRLRALLERRDAADKDRTNGV